jgi:hypothetical protein
MNSEKYTELEDRSAVSMLQRAELADAVKRMEAHSRVQDVIAAMKEEGKALELTDEEERMLRSFRRFKATIKKPGEVFKWQTRPVDADVLIVDGGEAAHIVDPQDVSDENQSIQGSCG